MSLDDQKPKTGELQQQLLKLSLSEIVYFCNFI